MISLKVSQDPFLLSRCFLLLVSFTICSRLAGQIIHSHERFVSKKWDNTDGLPVNSVFKITQDDTGYLWIITEEGLVRFDGIDFKVYNEGNTPELRDSWFFDLTEASDGGIWAANASSIVYANKNHVITYDVREAIGNSQLSSIEEDHTKVLWVGTDNGKLFRLVEGILEPLAAWDKEHTRDIREIRKIADGMAIGTENGLFKYDEGSETITEVAGLEGLEVRSLAAHPDGSLWIGTVINGLMILKNDQLRSITTSDGLVDNHVNALHIAADGSVWAGMSIGGVQIINGQEVISLPEEAFNHNEVRDIFISRDESIWMAVVGQGIIQMIPGTIRTLSAADGLSSDIMLAIFQDAESVIWAGTAGAGINRIENGSITQITKQEKLAHSIVLGIYGDSNYLYFGTGDGLYVYNPSTNKIKRRLTSEDGLASSIVQAIYHDSQQRLWIATRAGGIHRLGDDFRVERLNVPEEYQETDILNFFEDSKGNIWTGTFSAGLLKIAPDDKMMPFPIRHGPSSEMALTTWEDPEGDIWVGTNHGLAVLTDTTFRMFNQSHGLHFNGIFRIVEDDMDRIWMSSNFGIQSARIQDLLLLKHDQSKKVSIRLFDTSDGMANKEANGAIFPAGWKMNDGDIWFPTMRGIAIVDPKKYEKGHKPNILIKSVRHSGLEFDPLEGNIIVPPGVHNLEITFGSLDFQKPHSINYAYRLKNVHEEWEEAGNRTTAYFSALAPGTYQFEVTSEQFGVSSDIASLQFTVEPFFYQTIWFKGIILVALISTGYFISLFYIKHQVGIKLKEQVHTKTLELQQQNQILEAALNDVASQNQLIKEIAWVQSHQLRGPLSKIMSLVDVVKEYDQFEDIKKSKKQLLDDISITANELDDMLRSLNRNIEEIEKKDAKS